MFLLRKNSIYQWQPERGTCCLLKGQKKACLGVDLNSNTCVNEFRATSVCIVDPPFFLLQWRVYEGVQDLTTDEKLLLLSLNLQNLRG